MIISLKVGELWGVPAVVEIINKDRMLLEKVQSDPYYHNELISFDLEGKLLEISNVQDIVMPGSQSQKVFPRTKFGIQLDHKNGIITHTYGKSKVDTIRHAIETAYNEEAEHFLNHVRNLTVATTKKPLKEKVIDLLEDIRVHDFTQYLLYNIEE